MEDDPIKHEAMLKVSQIHTSLGNKGAYCVCTHYILIGLYAL